MPDMTTQITVKELFDSHSEKYSLQWISGQEGGKKFNSSRRNKR